MKPLKYALLFALSAIANGPTADAATNADALCTVGVFKGPGTAFVAITRSGNGFRYMFDTGQSGDVGETDGPVRCLVDAIAVTDRGTWPQVALKVTNTSFHSHDVELKGQLIEVLRGNPDAPLVVFAHGSEKTTWLEHAPDPYQMIGRGISVFVYDKRGTGRSEGTYTQNVTVLADDLVAASAEAKQLAKGRFGRFGLIGLSQGGWVAPLAAHRAGAEFIGVGYGLVMDIREEDAAQVALELSEAGFGEEVRTLARQITDATAHLARYPSATSIAAFEQIRRRFEGSDWLPYVRGDYTGILLDASVQEIETVILPHLQSYDIDWSVDPIATIEAVDVPQLWVFAARDRAAPPDISIKRLQMLRAAGQDITIRVFPDTDHGMLTFAQNEDRTRTYMGVVHGYHDLMADWARGHLQGIYGSAEVK